MSSEQRKVVFIDGCRIPFQKANTIYKDFRSYDLARMVLKELVAKAELPPEKIDYCIMGTVIANFTTSNVARDALLGAGLPLNIPAFTVTMACISANRAITSGIDLIQSGQADVVLAGGTESVSDFPIRYRKKFRQKLQEAQKYRKFWDYFKFFRGLSIADLLPEVPGITEFSTGKSMGKDCEGLVSRIGVTREEQDEFALRSHLAAAKASKEGLYEGEVIPTAIPPKFKLISEENGIRGDSTLEGMKKLKPAFVKPSGTITPGNASFLTDGAAAVLIMSEEMAKTLGMTPKASFHSYSYTAQDPEDELLLGPAYSTAKILQQTKLSLDDIGVFEFHEAFAGQIVASLKCLASDEFAREKLGREEKVGEISMDKFNTQGGSLSLGHPFGATGARLVTTAVNRLVREEQKYALVSGCAAGALGNAMIIERYVAE